MKEIIEKVAQLCSLAGVPVIPSHFTLTGVTAGQFATRGKECYFNFNVNFFSDEFMARTVPHEVAHYVRYYRNAYSYDRLPSGKRSSHGAKWKAVMLELGATDVTRCHSYDTSAVPKRVYKKFSYACDKGHEYKLTAIRHNRSQGGTIWYNCRECDSRLYFRGLGDKQ